MSGLFDQQFCASLGCAVVAFSVLLASFMAGKSQRPALSAPTSAPVSSAGVSFSLLPEDQYHKDKLSLRSAATFRLLPILRATQPPVRRGNLYAWVTSTLKDLEESGEWSWLPPSNIVTASLKTEVTQGIVNTITFKPSRLITFPSVEGGEAAIKREKFAQPPRHLASTRQGVAANMETPVRSRAGEPLTSTAVPASSTSHKRTQADDALARPSKRSKRVHWAENLCG